MTDPPCNLARGLEGGHCPASGTDDVRSLFFLRRFAYAATFGDLLGYLRAELATEEGSQG
jgi:hypothetical protein